jgi:hypothetical protein
MPCAIGVGCRGGKTEIMALTLAVLGLEVEALHLRLGLCPGVDRFKVDARNPST